MEKRVIYIARDGKEFEDKTVNGSWVIDGEFECRKYEMTLDLKESTLAMYKEHNRKIPKEEMSTDDTYNSVMKVIVKNDRDLKVLKKLISFCGYCEYEPIDSTGTWKYIDERFTKTA